MVVYQGPLEVLLSKQSNYGLSGSSLFTKIGLSSLFTTSSPKIPGAYPHPPLTIFPKSLTTKFIKVQLAFATTILAMELLGSDSRTKKIYLYSLYPMLEMANRWLWAMMVGEEGGVMVGPIRVGPVVMVVFGMVMGGMLV